jgi:fatty acid omega-hydroxylase
MTAAESAWAAAMSFEHRHDPYQFFDQLRETPVVQVADRTYVVTGYRELMTLAHDPRISSDISRSPLGAPAAAGGTPAPGADGIEAYGRAKTIILSDPPDHDRARRQVMRHFAPPHSPDVIPNI